MRIIVVFCLLLISCGGGGSASSEPNRTGSIRVVYTQHQDAWQEQDVISLAKDAINYFNHFAETDLVLQDVRPISNPNDTSRDVGLFEMAERWHVMRHHALNNGLSHNARKREFLLFIDAPLLGGGDYWFAGWANICALYDNASTGIAHVTWRSTRDSYATSALYIAHELGHLLGAKHEDGPFNLMDPGNSNFLGLEDFPNLNLTPSNIQQIHGCFKRRTRRVIRACKKSNRTRRCRRRHKCNNNKKKN